MQALPSKFFQYIAEDGWQRIHSGKTRLIYAWLDGDLRAFEAEHDYHLQGTKDDHDQDEHGNWATGNKADEKKLDPNKVVDDKWIEDLFVQGEEEAKAEAEKAKAEAEKPYVSPVGPEAKKTAIEKVEALKESLIGDTVDQPSDDDDNSTPVPDSWDMVSTSQQDEVFEKWKSNNYNSFHESEVESYWQEQYIRDAQYQIWDEEDWANKKLAEVLEARGVDLEKSGLLDKEGGLDGSILGASWNNNKKGSDEFNNDYSISKMAMVDNTGLINPEIYSRLVNENGEKMIVSADPAQGQLEGVPQPGNPAESQLAADLLSDFESAVIDKIDNASDWMEAPEYLGESVDEYMNDYWNNSMEDSEKFGLAKDQFGDDWESEAGSGGSSGESVEIKEPSEYKLLQDGQDYERTRVLGNALTEARFMEVLAERGLVNEHGTLVKDKDMGNISAQAYVSALWGQWKSHSAKDEALALHLASAEELGGYFYQINDKTAKDIRTWANTHMDGGYEGLKAYVRAQWEVNQYLFEKAGVDHVDVFRGIMMDGNIVNKETQQVKLGDGYYGTALPTLFIHQNGAASFSAMSSVSNSWQGVGNLPPNPTRVVIRARVPASAVLSLPVFGKNIHSEQEVVVTGLPWKSWDAWKGTAPGFSEFDILHPRGPDGRFIEKPDWAEVDAQSRIKKSGDAHYIIDGTWYVNPDASEIGWTFTKGLPSGYKITKEAQDQYVIEGQGLNYLSAPTFVEAFNLIQEKAVQPVTTSDDLSKDAPVGYKIEMATSGQYVVSGPNGYTVTMSPMATHAEALKKAQDHAFKLIKEKAVDINDIEKSLGVPDGAVFKPPSTPGYTITKKGDKYIVNGPTMGPLPMDTYEEALSIAQEIYKEKQAA